ncbi:hypothetical protein [Paraburkholderia sp. J76]|uniref:hypothetical protein n=1 Tax=Paraburkholderia sp. J76 TaxID=2805439 RepID=UPI002ABDE7EB|nr:hypothetical protein [Paraburkholderia sp. J76]
MPSCKSSDAVRVKPWLAHTPQPDEPPPDQPREPDVPPVGDPPAPPGEVPRAAHERRFPSTNRSPVDFDARLAHRALREWLFARPAGVIGRS